MAGPWPMARRFAAALLVLAVGPTVALDLLRQGGLVAAAPTAGAHIEASMLAWLLTCAAVAALARWWPPGLPWGRPQLPGVLGRYLPFVLLWLLGLLGYLLLASRLGLVVPPQPVLDYLAAGAWQRPGYWCVLAGTVVGAPLAEEIVFRGYLQPALLAVLSPRAAIALGAAVFGLLHGLPYALPVAVLGGFFGWLAVRQRSLWPAVVAHAVHNGVTAVVACCWPTSLELLYAR